METDVESAAFRQQLAALERDIAQLSVSDNTRGDFFRLFLERVMAVLGDGGAVWKIGEHSQLTTICHINLALAGLEEQGRQFELLGNALNRVAETSGPVVLPSYGGTDMYDGGLGKAGANDSPHTLLFVPIMAMDKVTAILLLISPREVDPRAVRGYVGFLQGLCDHAGIFLQRQQIRELEGQIAQSDRLRQFVSSVHSGLDPKRTCYALANYAQELLTVYRCMAGTFSSRGKFRMEAVSGVESVAVKSSFIKSITQIARQVCRNDKVLLVDNPNIAVKDGLGDGDDLLTAARLYMLQAGSMVLGIFPIRSDKRVVGALVVELATEQAIDQPQRRKIEGLLAEAGSALSNSLTYRHLPLSPLVRAVGAIRDKIYMMARVRLVVWAAVVLAIVITPLLVQKELKVIGTAELVPIEARSAYVAQEGVIEDVFVSSGQKVDKGQVLASLDTRIIDSEIDRVTNAVSEATLARDEAGQSADVRAQYVHRLAALTAEWDKLLLQKKQYDIKAPVAGVVITGQSEITKLPLKPVVRGDAVFDVVPGDSPWWLLVNVPEDEAGELLRAYDRLDPDETGKFLEANVILNAYPKKIFRSKVLSVARRAHVMATGQQKYRNVIEVRVSEPESLRDDIEPRQGMEGKVAIECGKRSLFYAVTHEFADFVRVSMF